MPLLLGFSIALALLAWAVAHTIRPSHEVHFSYLVSLSEREDRAEYRFDGYYAIQATDLFTTTLAAWIGTPEVIQAAYTEAGLEMEAGIDPRHLIQAITAKKTAPQLIEVTVRGSDPEKARRLADGLMSVMDKNIDQYHDQGIPALTFRVVTTEPWQGSITLATNVIAGAVFMFSLFIGINIVLLAEASRQSVSTTTSNSVW